MIDVNTIRITNLKKIVDVEFNGSLNLLAKNIGKSVNIFYLIQRGERKFGENLARQVEEKLNLPTGTLDKTEGSDENISLTASQTINENIAQIAEYSTQLISSKGELSQKDIISTILIDNKLLKSLFIEQIDSVVGFTINDNSMQPELAARSRILVDTSVNTLINGNIYALCKNNEVFFRRVFKEIGANQYQAKADNPIHENVYFTLDNDVKVIGAVIALVSKRLFQL